jgi:hypothetical protein
MKLKEIILAIILISAANPITALFAQKLAPLSLMDLENLLEGRVTQARIVQLVDQEGISFELTPSLRNKLQKAGAGANLIEALAKASASIATRPPSGSMERPTVRETAPVTLQSSKAREKALTRSDRGADEKHANTKSRPAQPARTVKTNQLADCSAITKKGQLEALSTEEIETLRTGCR